MTPAITALIATTAPLAGFFVALVLFRRVPAAAAAASILSGLVALGCALRLLAGGPVQEVATVGWLVSEGTPVMFGFLLDGTNLIMGTVVAGVALLIQLYSLGYMSGDPGRSRYFAMLGLFAWAMLSFVYAASLLQAFVFWELVGLASFFLIGFWFEKPAAAAAGRKAFVMTRIGDVGLFIGIILLHSSVGSLDILHLCDAETLARIPASRLTLIGLLLFCGVVGKSAQFPLHTWLPDAMEGPTPVSALLHSATMVAAGVFLFARLHPLFMASHTVVMVVLVLAVFTALLSATMAMVAMDIKRVLAYSSISQLSFMLIGLASGDLFAGVFHLTTHAMFKALLFLCAGAYIHRFHSNDLVAIGRAGGRSMRWTSLGLLVGGAALAGFPPLAGFFSKETILHALAGQHQPVLLGATYLASFLTAYYSFRMIFLVLRPNPDSNARVAEPAGEGHGASWSMRGPIILLTVAAAGLGFLGDRIAGLLALEVAHPSWAEMAPAVGVMLAGLALALVEFGRPGARQRGFVTRIPALHRLFVRKWFIDELYGAVVARALAAVSRACAMFEGGIDSASDGVGGGTIRGGEHTAGWTQRGRFQVYIGAAVLSLALFCYLVGGR